jgi:hypothetical protein
MSRKSPVTNVVRRPADSLPAATEADVARLRAALDAPIDTSEIPEKVGPFNRIKRDASGRLPRRREGPIRRAILDALESRGMTRYQLWRAARLHCDTLSQSAVYEYLRGQRDIGLRYAEALMEASGVTVRPKTKAFLPKAHRTAACMAANPKKNRAVAGKRIKPSRPR